MLGRYILPQFGKLPLTALERAQVVELHHRLYETPSIANMVVRTLSLMYRLAEDWGMVPEGCNPCRSVGRYPERKRERFLTADEFTRLGKVLDEVEIHGDASASAVAALRLLMLTGCRKSEILTLRWEHLALKSTLWVIERPTGWVRPSSGRTRRRRSNHAGLGEAWNRRSSRLSSGWIGSTTADSSRSSGTDRRRRPKRRTIASGSTRHWPRDSTKTLSGIPGAVQSTVLTGALFDVARAAHRPELVPYGKSWLV